MFELSSVNGLAFVYELPLLTCNNIRNFNIICRTVLYEDKKPKLPPKCQSGCVVFLTGLAIDIEEATFAWDDPSTPILRK